MKNATHKARRDPRSKEELIAQLKEEQEKVLKLREQARAALQALEYAERQLARAQGYIDRIVESETGKLDMEQSDVRVPQRRGPVLGPLRTDPSVVGMRFDMPRLDSEWKRVMGS